MNDRKQHVIKKAHQLFIDKGFQATSIQDILDYSSISKGTFYNYFSSKNELLIALLKEIYYEMENKRNKLLIGHDPTDIDILIKQIELQIRTNHKNKLMTLFEEVLVSADKDLKKFIKEGQLRMIQWTYYRFLQIFGDEKKPYLLDCAVMFMGILQQNVKYSAMGNQLNADLHKIVRFSVNRIVAIVHEVAETGEQLLETNLLDSWLPNKSDQTEQQALNESIQVWKEKLSQNKELEKYIELLDFIQDELFQSINPRKLLIESTLESLKNALSSDQRKQFLELEQQIAYYLGK